MLRHIIRILSVILVVSIALPEVGVPVTSVAHAQQKKRKNLLDLLFGGAARKQRQARQERAKKKALAKRVRIKKKKPSSRKRTTRKAKVNSGASAALVPAVVNVEKNEDAAKVLVIGDFMADGLHEGLERIFAENPAIVFINASKGLSGFVRDDVLDWPGTIKETIETHKPALVIGLLGMNDRQEIRVTDGRAKKLSEAWKIEYELRVETLFKNIREARLPTIWVGLPPVSSGKMNADYLTFNSIYRSKVELFGGTFVDVWNGFVDIEGRFIRSGPDIDGRIVALRRNDGINMTRAGKIKLGFFTEKAVKRQTGIGKDALFSSLGSLSDQTQQQTQYDPVTSGKTVVIALGSPAADGGDELEGGEGFLTASDATNSNGFDLLARGELNSGVVGRIDAGWGKSSFGVGRSEIPEPMLANIRGLDFKSQADIVVVPPVKPAEATAKAPATQ